MQQPAELSAKISGLRADRISHVMFKLASHAALNAHRVGRSKWPQQPVPSSSCPPAHRWAWSLGLPSHVDPTIRAPIDPECICLLNAQAEPTAQAIGGHAQPPAR